MTFTPTTSGPQTTSDLLVRGLVLIGQEYRGQRVLVENVGTVAYCQARAVLALSRYSSFLPNISCQTLIDEEYDRFSDNCLRPGDQGVFSFQLDSSDTPLTAAGIQLQGVRTTVSVPDPELTVVEVKYSPTAFPNYSYVVTLANQNQKTASSVRGPTILKDAQGQFIGYETLYAGYPADFPTGDDRCMFVGDLFATYDCIKPGKTKDFGVRKSPEYDWDNVASVEPFPQWRRREQIQFAPANGVTIRLEAISGKLGGRGDAVFVRDGVVFYNTTGGGGGGRGINVATIDPATGVLLELKSFDTWSDAEAGSRLVSFLETLPVGTIVMMSVADEGSSTLYAASRDAISELLGSQLIHNLAYWDRWAMISVIGREVSISEDLVPYARPRTREAMADWDVALP
ncbi:hypothetical protein A3H10_00560 [Candidatus Uhrbacteria bacterium RIFCSPLOWO2_12_FULL_46_10]|nr:MAG: hypothetical protein A3H10_00560 [Candidatus Uhrbacteria bacterium RIFCSPLOWO2_12_FULL_46_10]